jgi:hypothetical protein
MNGPSGRFLRFGGVSPNDHSVCKARDFIGWHSRTPGVFSNGVRIRCLTNADGAKRPVCFLNNAGSNPTNPVGHFVITDMQGPCGSGFRFPGVFPGIVTTNDASIHEISPVSLSEFTCSPAGT